jgi:hypothetical protein
MHAPDADPEFLRDHIFHTLSIHRTDLTGFVQADGVRPAAIRAAFNDPHVYSDRRNADIAHQGVCHFMLS